MTEAKKSILDNVIRRISIIQQYFWIGVWKDRRDNIWIRILKTLNLSVRSFLDRDLQARSMALTYSTVLAIVPAFAMILAICRGFGLQDILLNTLPQYFPAQTKAIDTAFSFVDDYLKQASSGIFVGVGIIVLLWTVVSLLSYIEDAFNKVWDIRHDRSFYQKITDYIAICLLIPVLLICSSGISIFVSTTLQDKIHISFLTPLINTMLELMPVVLAWLAFSLSFFLIPNTKVSLKYSAISGAICAIAFQIVELLFVNGQIYVSKYNAIYGSFSFLPLLMIWIQISWLILLFGCVLTFSMQNVFAFNYLGDISHVSHNYMQRLSLVVACIVATRFAQEKTPMTRLELSRKYFISARIVGEIIERLRQCKLINLVELGKDEFGVAPATDTESITVGEVMQRLDNLGSSGFIPDFEEMYPAIDELADKWDNSKYDLIKNIKLTDIELPSVSALQSIAKGEESLQPNNKNS